MNANKFSAGKGLPSRILIPAGLAVLLFAPLHLWAGEYNLREAAMLPTYCKYAQDFRARVPGGNNQEEIDRWYKRLGPTFHHMHHYCYGLVDTMRATVAHSTRERMSWLRGSIGEFDYVIQRAPPDFVLLPEFHTKKGENLIRLGQAPRGVVELQRAIGIKPDYWPPYAAMSDYFKGAGNLNKAREILEQGLSAAPDAKALQRRLAELGGTKGTRKAAPQPTEKPAPSAEEPATPTPQPEPPAVPEPPAPR